MPSSPPGAAVPKPVFTRRPHPSKRRARSRHVDLSLPPRDATAPILSSAGRATSVLPVAARAPRKLHPRPRSLLSAPRIQGYQHETTSESHGPPVVDYSAAGLARLRAATIRPALPAVVAEATVTEPESPAVPLVTPHPPPPHPHPPPPPSPSCMIPRPGTASPLSTAALLSGKHAASSHGPVSRPDPFSVAWRDSLTRGEVEAAQVDDDGDVVLVDDYAGMSDGDNAPAYIPLEERRTDMSVIGAAIEEDGDGSDEAEWEMSLLRRTGHLAALEKRSAPEVERISALSKERGRRIVREAEEGMVMTTSGSSDIAAQRCLRVVHETQEEWTAKRKQAEEKMQRLDDAEGRSKEEIRCIERDAEKQRKKLAFYDRLVARVDDVSDMLDEKQGIVKEWNRERLERLRAEAEEIEAVRGGHPDEFGRNRAPSLDVPEIVEDVEAARMGPFEDVEEDVADIKEICQMFRKWKREYAADYNAAFGDVGLGKLVGALALGRAVDDLEWMRNLSDSQLRPAIQVEGVFRHVCQFVKARWQPRGAGSEVLEVAARVVNVLPDDQAELIVQCCREQVAMEMKACMVVGDAIEAGATVCGAVDCVRAIGIDIGVLGLLQKFGELSSGALRGKVAEAIRWVAEGGDGIVREDSVMLARLLNGDSTRERTEV